MRVAWATDIHLNFLDEEGVRRFGREVAELKPEAFVVTGDIAEAPSLIGRLTMLADASGVPAHFVLGNHDFYDGEVSAVRAAVRDMSPSVGAYLPEVGPLRLGDDTVIVGVDGWGDARLGDPRGTRVRLNDFLHIRDLVSPDYETLLWKLRAQGDAEAETARSVLAEALRADAKRIVVATHVPPFREACWHEGAISNDDWLPFFTCKAVGDVLVEVARGAPDRDFLVLCGHTHGRGRTTIRPNLEVRTGAAEYGAPVVELLAL